MKFLELELNHLKMGYISQVNTYSQLVGEVYH
jgi:hypothetical protein